MFTLGYSVTGDAIAAHPKEAWNRFFAECSNLTGIKGGTKRKVSERSNQVAMYYIGLPGVSVMSVLIRSL